MTESYLSFEEVSAFDDVLLPVMLRDGHQLIPVEPGQAFQVDASSKKHTHQKLASDSIRISSKPIVILYMYETRVKHETLTEKEL